MKFEHHKLITDEFIILFYKREVPLLLICLKKNVYYENGGILIQLNDLNSVKSYSFSRLG